MSTHVVILGAGFGGFFNCPPAPYETAVMLHDNLARLWVRDATAIHLVTPMPKPIPISDETSDALFTPPSLEGAEDKRRFAAFRRDRWFGPGSGESLPDGTTPDSPSLHEEKS